MWSSRRLPASRTLRRSRISAPPGAAARARGTWAPEANLGRAAVAVRFERCHQVPGAIDQAHPVRRIFMQHGQARIVETLRNEDAFGHQRMALDKSAAH